MDSARIQTQILFRVHEQMEADASRKGNPCAHKSVLGNIRALSWRRGKPKGSFASMHCLSELNALNGM